MLNRRTFCRQSGGDARGCARRGHWCRRGGDAVRLRPAAAGDGRRPPRQDHRRPFSLCRPRHHGDDGAEDAGEPVARHGHGSPAADGRAGHRRRSPEHQPVLVLGWRPGARAQPDRGAEREAGGVLRRARGSIRRPRDGGAAASRPRRRAARRGHEAWGCAACRSAAASTARSWRRRGSIRSGRRRKRCARRSSSTRRACRT